MGAGLERSSLVVQKPSPHRDEPGGGGVGGEVVLVQTPRRHRSRTVGAGRRDGLSHVGSPRRARWTPGLRGGGCARPEMKSISLSRVAPPLSSSQHFSRTAAIVVNIPSFGAEAGDVINDRTER